MIAAKTWVIWEQIYLPIKNFVKEIGQTQIVLLVCVLN